MSSGKRPVGYLIHYNDGLAGEQGIGYDYVLGANGIMVQSGSPHIVARIYAAECDVRGLAVVSEKFELVHGPIPSHLFELGLRCMQVDPDHERFFAIQWRDDEYHIVTPKQDGTAASLHYTPINEPGVVAEFHSHGKMPAFFSATDDADEQGFRIYGVVGRVGKDRPELNLRLGVYGHFAHVFWPDVFEGDPPTLHIMTVEDLQGGS